MTYFSRPELVGHIAGIAIADRPLRLVGRRCGVCGIDIIADAADPGPQVLRHNQTARHRSEAIRRGWLEP
ncbi:MAG: hypothetical protein MUD06_10780 [Rhodospirillales bacterium]|jgi:hypothetical protein|nr:hypothetical protein [Rhodospirillales bacterium]